MITSLKRTFSFISSHPLAKRHLMKSLFRMVLWQIRSTFISGLIPMPFVEHTKSLAKKGLAGATGNIYAGLHEFNDMAFLIHFLRETDTFFDVGANVGSYSILAAGLKKSHCITFEPAPSTFEILKKNLELNNIKHLVEAKNCGVGKEEHLVHFTLNEDTTNHVVEVAGDHTSAVKIVPLDNFYTQTPSLIKIDVEGFETEVINGAAKILKNSILKAIIIELNGCGERYGFTDKNIHKLLTDLGFKPYKYLPFERKLSLLDTFGDFNTIYIRDIEFVEERILSAPPFEIFGETI